jgi:hypothetical protein
MIVVNRDFRKIRSFEIPLAYVDYITPAPFFLRVPPDPSLIGHGYYAQGMLVDPIALSGVVFGLTDGTLIRIGL